MEAKEIDILVEQYGDSVFSFCKVLAYCREDAEDLYQQTFLKSLELYKKIDLNHNPKSYLLSIASNIWKNEMSKRTRHQRIAPESNDSEEYEVIANIPSSVEILGDIIKREEIKNVKKIVNELPEKYRIIVIMYYTSEMSVEEIAKAMKIPKGTVKSRLFKARELVKKRWEALS